MKKYFFACILIVCTTIACTTRRSQTSVPQSGSKNSSISDWILQGNIYEVNVRQYTKEGTFKAFQKHLDRLQNMGVQTLWFMPISPISKVDRKGTLGSYYAIAHYTDVNPEYGTMQDWKDLVNDIHSRGMKVIIDWVPNHTGADHYWLTKYPDFFLRDSTGNFVAPFDWTDVRKLNYNNTVMKDSMIAAMKYWIQETDIDGYRCDVAGEVPDDFWKTCITVLRRQKPIFMLAEADKPSLHAAGFDATYPWNMFVTMKHIAKGTRPAFAIDSVLNNDNAKIGRHGLRMYFTSNHDENSWNKADFETMPGASHAPFAVLTQTLVRGVPLIYSGQEEPVTRAIEFFEKDPMPFGKYQRQAFYKTLLNLRKSNPALAADASYKKFVVGDEKSVYAFSREKDGRKVLVITNLSATEQPITVTDITLHGRPYNVFKSTIEPVTSIPFKLQPWGYVIYEYK